MSLNSSDQVHLFLVLRSTYHVLVRIPYLICTTSAELRTADLYMYLLFAHTYVLALETALQYGSSEQFHVVFLHVHAPAGGPSRNARG